MHDGEAQKIINSSCVRAVCSLSLSLSVPFQPPFISYQNFKVCIVYNHGPLAGEEYAIEMGTE